MNAPFNPNTPPRTQQLDDGSRIIDDEPPLELQPQFTEQDAQRDLATLTIQELTELQKDLTGIQVITNGFTGLGLGGDTNTGEINVYGGESDGDAGSSPPAPVSAYDDLLLAALDRHMRKLPAKSTAAYFMATTKCPDEVSNERKLMFLQCEENSIPLAAERLALYWQYRLDGFGEDRCFEPMTLAGAMKDEVINMAKSGMYQLMPTTDAAGRAIVYVRLAKRDFSRYTVRQELMWLTYLMEIVVQHKNLRSRGYVYLFDASNGAGKHYKRESTQYMCRALDDIFPIRRCSVHICNASPLVKYVVFPVVQRFTPKNTRLRNRLHRSSGDDLLRSLAEFNLPRDRLPSDLGGGVVMDINQFLIDRFPFEASHSGINLQASGTDKVDQADHTCTTLSSASPNQAPPIDGPLAEGAAATAVSRGTRVGSKRKGAQNIVDPRMAKAVRAKQEDPDLSLYDALLFGGFAFPQKGPGQTDNDVFDADGVSLKQRKNNLCRRLRGDRKKGKEKTNMPVVDGGTVMARRDSFDEEIEAFLELDGLDDEALDGPWLRESKKRASKAMDIGTASVTQNQAPAVISRRDSFDDEIQGLPGLDGLDNRIGRF